MLRAILILIALTTAHSARPVHAQISPADADFDASGAVDFADFLIFTAALGETGPTGDLDNSGLVDFVDFLLFSSVFGRATEARVVTTPAGTSHDLWDVPAGFFQMGSDEGEIDELPIHTVYLDTYYIDRHEVTNAHYLAFLVSTGSTSDVDGNLLIDTDDPHGQIRQTTDGYTLADSARSEHPVVAVSWHGAQAYCEWMGGRLPTEAEWEKAARGTDGRAYPWGNDLPSAERANHDFTVGATTPVGSYPDGVSPYGVHDLAGNVWEWVSDWNDISYYAESPSQNPPGPESGSFRSIRGGAWGSASGGGLTSVRSAMRASATPWATGNGNIGFRCVVTP